MADSIDDREAARAALLRHPASAAPKYFYDRLGSHLFEAITELPEYYPTRTEAAIFASHGAAMASVIGSRCSAGKPEITLIDLGAGNCVKASKLFPLLEPRRYVAVDISVEFLREALKRVQREQPALSVVGVGLDFSASLDLPAELIEGRPVFFYPGSSIGNFAPDEALAFLRRVHERAQGPAPGGGLLIGIDLVKPHDALQRAYDDALGVTAAFNLNLLRQLNRLIGSDFEPRQWQHVGLYNPIESRIEMHLEAREALAVRWHGTERRFATGERIHTENSYKYTVERFAALLQSAGFGATRYWTDERGWFAVFWASA
ncbi:MAG TPA: L-histidine N(alpha)-methyltransferase [Burkholderiaceae bacterium]|nr:L-histidine N(alpha)-methyltransferase [Burkholderiaceae bacterium]